MSHPYKNLFLSGQFWVFFFFFLPRLRQQAVSFNSNWNQFYLYDARSQREHSKGTFIVRLRPCNIIKEKPDCSHNERALGNGAGNKTAGRKSSSGTRLGVGGHLPRPLG